MLSVYEAISFENRIEKGGSTYPWIVNVLTEEGIETYVVKLFTEKHIEQYNPVVNEVVASLLATEFDLPTPAPALINFSADFIDTLSSPLKKELKKKDTRIKFGCKYIPGATSYSPALHRKFFKRYEVDSIFAFDNLIQNVDRRNEKPNILLLDKRAYLIDHELSLSSINEKLANDLRAGHWRYNKERHIFYEYLKKGRKKDKLSYFETFLENLRHLNVNKADEYLSILETHGYSTEAFTYIKSYLAIVKNDCSKFINLLRNSIL